MPLVFPASGETQDRPGSVLVRKSGHADDDVLISALDPFHEIDGRKSLYITEVLDWYGREDARDLKRNELHELIGNMTCLNALAGEFWKCNAKVVTDEQSWKFWQSNQKIGMSEELVQNCVMNEKTLEELRIC